MKYYFNFLKSCEPNIKKRREAIFRTEVEMLLIYRPYRQAYKSLQNHLRANSDSSHIR